MRKLLTAALAVGISLISPSGVAQASTVKTSVETRHCDTVNRVCLHVRTWVSDADGSSGQTDRGEVWIFCVNEDTNAYRACRAIDTINVSLIEVTPHGLVNRDTHTGPTCSAGSGGTLHAPCPLTGITLQTLTKSMSEPATMVYADSASAGTPANTSEFSIGCCQFNDTRRIFW
jgi:hypothetical protein